MKSQTILYVCVHNSGRSQMAEAMTNTLAKQMNLPVRALSAGTVVGKSLNPIAVEVMREFGISMESQSPKIVTQAMVDESDQIISMGCGVDAEACPTRFILTEDWGLDDPAGQPIGRVREIRDQIRERVELLLAELASR